MPASAKTFRILGITLIMGLSGVIGLSIPVSAQDFPSDTWLGIYRGESKIGYVQLLADKETYKEKPGYRCDSRIFTRILALGMMVEQELLTRIHLNEQFQPLAETFEMRSGGSVTKIEAAFEAERIVATVYSEGTKTNKIIPIPEGSTLVGDLMFLPATRRLEIGEKFAYEYFNPAALALEDVFTEVVRKETIEVDGVSHEALLLRNMTSLGEMKCWLDEKGGVLKVSAILGLNMIREPREKALKFDNSYLPPEDLAVATSAPTDREIISPRYVRDMTIRLVGLADEKLAISDKRQQATYTPGEPPVGEFKIAATDFDLDKAPNRPIKDRKLAEYLKATPYIQSGNEEIKAKAKAIVGDETNAYLAAGMIRAWVNINMKSKADIGIMRSAVDVLHGKTGVCRDYAVLYAALARAAGIPTKMVSGLVYFEGRFYYHAWAESFVGEWVPLDATLTTDFVDATHIKLAEGEATSMFDMVKTMGALKAEVIQAD
ncbi:MAG: transglutaminase domain-containing protein [Armatimonadetes bacterium]|nr:transglutaminase domain-containing protein [Armatimonadota bacterium]